jgi:FkbM family methyltransferase
LRLALRAYPLQRGRKKLVLFVGRHISGPLIWEMSDGSKMLLDLANYIDREIVIKGGFERLAIDHMVNVIIAGGYDAFIDIGANIGLYAIAVARKTRAEVVAFEPDPRNRSQMAGNLFLNGLESMVALLPEAVGDRDGEVLLHTQRAPGHLSTGLSSLIGGVSGSVPVPVRMVALGDFLAWRGRRIAVKMDIEGAELAALRGMQRLIIENKVFLQIEIAASNLAKVRHLLCGYNLKEISEDSSQFGDSYFVTNEGPEAAPASDASERDEG